MSPHRDLVYAPSHVSNKINRLRNIVRNVNLDWRVQQFARVSLVPRSDERRWITAGRRIRIRKEKKNKAAWLNCRSRTLLPSVITKGFQPTSCLARHVPPISLNSGPINILNTRPPFRNRSESRKSSIRQVARRRTDYSRLSLLGISEDRRARRNNKERSERKEEGRDGNEEIVREREKSLIPSSCVKLRLNYVTKFQQSVERRPKLWRNNAMIIKAFAADSDKPSIVQWRSTSSPILTNNLPALTTTTTTQSRPGSLGNAGQRRFTPLPGLTCDQPRL